MSDLENLPETELDDEEEIEDIEEEDTENDKAILERVYRQNRLFQEDCHRSGIFWDH